jgi:hypothetical protein
MIADLPPRIDAINARDELVFRIAEVHLFGSLVRGDPEVTSIDLAVRLEPRRPGANWRQESFGRAEARGPRSLHVTRMRAFGVTEVFSLMRAANRYLRLARWEDVDPPLPSRRIYPRPSPAHAAAGEGEAPDALDAEDDGAIGRSARTGISGVARGSAWPLWGPARSRAG